MAHQVKAKKLQVTLTSRWRFIGIYLSFLIWKSRRRQRTANMQSHFNNQMLPCLQSWWTLEKLHTSCCNRFTLPFKHLGHLKMSLISVSNYMLSSEKSFAVSYICKPALSNTMYCWSPGLMFAGDWPLYHYVYSIKNSCFLFSGEICSKTHFIVERCDPDLLLSLAAVQRYFLLLLTEVRPSNQSDKIR